MQTPVKITEQEFMGQRNSYYAESCTWDKSRYRHLCRECKNPIQDVAVYLSIHDGPFRDICGGTGRVIRGLIPYCPKCETAPANSGCLHPDVSKGRCAL